MNLILSTHNVTLTKAIEDHLVGRINKLDHLNRWLTNARVTLEHDHTRAPERQFACSIRLRVRGPDLFAQDVESDLDRKSTRLNSSHQIISYAVFCLKKKKKLHNP